MDIFTAEVLPAFVHSAQGITTSYGSTKIQTELKHLGFSNLDIKKIAVF